MRTLAMVLAGGEGKRLAPLTADRAKPAVPFGGSYRIIDFALSNLVNGGFRQIIVLTQYKSHSLDRHLAQTWRLNPMLGNYVTSVPAQMRRGPHWFAGSADAIYQNLNLVSDERPDYICVFGADHIYRMDPSQMVEQHVASGAGLTVAAIRAPLAEASAFGVIEPGRDHRIAAFREKPAGATGLPDSPNQVLASMGNYVFTASTLIDAVTSDADDADSRHDVGGNIVPNLVSAGDACYYDFATNEVPGALDRDRGYWRDVGELDAYYDAQMDLISPEPVFNLYNHEWPIHTWHPPLPPAKFVFEDGDRRGQAFNSLVSAGCIISGGTVRRSVLSAGVLVEQQALVEGSILMDGVKIHAGAVVRNAIIDKVVDVPAGVRIGVDLNHDRKLFTVSPRGIVVIGKGQKVPAALV
jgi:glucose-1-phosphate adenylyltransferase